MPPQFLSQPLKVRPTYPSEFCAHSREEIPTKRKIQSWDKISKKNNLLSVGNESRTFQTANRDRNTATLLTYQEQLIRPICNQLYTAARKAPLTKTGNNTSRYE